MKKEIPTITNSPTTTTALTTVENKIPNVSDLVQKTDSDAKTSGIENKYFYYLWL